MFVKQIRKVAITSYKLKFVVIKQHMIDEQARCLRFCSRFGRILYSGRVLGFLVTFAMIAMRIRLGVGQFISDSGGLYFGYQGHQTRVEDTQQARRRLHNVQTRMLKSNSEDSLGQRYGHWRRLRTGLRADRLVPGFTGQYRTRLRRGWRKMPGGQSLHIHAHRTQCRQVDGHWPLG